jgi:hypothetical protein
MGVPTRIVARLAHLDTLARAALRESDFLARMFLRRVGVYPSEGYASFDYTISLEETQYVLTVRIDEEGEVLGVGMES